MFFFQDIILFAPMNDVVIKISLPVQEENKLPDLNGYKRQEIFRSRATQILKKEFGKDYWTLREGRGTSDIELKVSIKKERLAEFRARIAELGFTELNLTPEQMSDNDAGRA